MIRLRRDKAKDAPRAQRRIAAILADTHGGHVLGLLNPATLLVREADDGQAELWTPEPTETQRQLTRCLNKFTQEMVEFVGGDEVLVIHDGDATQGDVFNHTIPDTTLEDQRTIAYYNLLPLVQLPTCRAARLITGTGIHVPEAAEARIAAKLAEATGKDIQAVHHERLSISGVVFDISHHGPPPGSRDWLFGNVATLYLRDRVDRDRRLGKEPADVYVRGHDHRWVEITINEEWEGVYRTYRLVVLPSLCGLGEYARKVTRSEPSLDVGMGLFEIVGGKLVDVKPLKETWDLRTEEVL